MGSDSEKGWLVVGLGNPGAEYERSRHNLGFMVVDRLAAVENVVVRNRECRSLTGRTMVDGKRVDLAKPQTFMNLSGEAVRCLVDKEGRSIDRLIVVSDDLALPFGTIRLRRRGSHGGHNGLRSVIDHLRTEEFIRLRIGILPDHPVSNTRDFVLQDFPKSEEPKVERKVEKCAEAVRAVITDGIEKAMAKWNADQSLRDPE